MDKQNLIERIADERRKIERTVDGIRIRLEKMKSASGEDLEDLKDLVAMRLPAFYMGIENIFKRIAQEIDIDEPQEENWHKDLLQQMSMSRPSRPSVISTKTAVALALTLKFRHRLRNIYVFELDLEKTVENAQQVCDIFDSLSEELDVFTVWLNRQESDE